MKKTRRNIDKHENAKKECDKEENKPKNNMITGC